MVIIISRNADKQMSLGKHEQMSLGKHGGSVPPVESCWFPPHRGVLKNCIKPFHLDLTRRRDSNYLLPFAVRVSMAPPLSKTTSHCLGFLDVDSGEPSLPITLTGPSFLANGHPILTHVPGNILVTPSPSLPVSEGDTNMERQGCFVGFDADDQRSWHLVSIGKLSGIRFTSIFRFKMWWSTHWIGHSGKDVELETQMMILDKNETGRPYILLLPIIEGPFRSSLQAGADDFVDICVESGSTQVCESRFRRILYIHVNHDPYRLVRDAMKVVRDHLGTFRLVEEKTPPRIIDKFGWCTWDAFYLKVDHKGVRDGVKGLVEGGCPPGWVLIDDGWQSICHDDQDPNSDIEGMDRLECSFDTAELIKESPRLKTFEANYKFRNYTSPRVPSEKGMRTFVRDLKEEFRTIDRVYVWHALLGYWGGIRRNTPSMPDCKVMRPTLSPGMQKTMDDSAENNIMSHGVGFVPPDLAYKLYDGMHSYLESVGVDGVKIDYINMLEMLSEEYGGQVEAAKTYYKALNASLRKHFKENEVICSMQQANDFLFLGTEVISLGRVGDDFWVRDSAGDPAGQYWLQGCHMAHCAYNSIWMTNFIYPDWDMFQTTHPLAEFHAASRAISGGPVYISDFVQKHNFKLLKKLVLPDGSILRCQYYALPTRDRLFDDPLHDGKTMLKLWNLNKYTGVLGLFNCQGGGWCSITRRNKGHPSCKGRVHCVAGPKDIEWRNGNFPISIKEDDTFAVYIYRAMKLKVMKFQEMLEFSVEPFDYELLTVSPAVSLPTKSIQLAPVGLVNMLNPGGAVQSLEVDAEGTSVRIGVKGCGEVMSYASEKPRSCKIDGVEVEFCYQDYMVTVRVPWPNSPGLSMIGYLF